MPSFLYYIDTYVFTERIKDKEKNKAKLLTYHLPCVGRILRYK